jgi:thiamine-phosphate pyrophosphorylase
VTALEQSLRLIVILDTDAAAGRDLAGLATAAVGGGATMLQLRAKQVGGREAAGLAARILAAAGSVPFVVNDRLDVALAIGAAGCHLGQTDLPIDAARRLAPPGFLLGGSAATAEEARRASDEGADYLGIGPLAATPSKADAAPPIGWDGFARIHAAVPHLPAVGIGGIDTALAAGARAAGAAGIAVISAVLGAADPLAATRALRAAVGP